MFTSVVYCYIHFQALIAKAERLGEEATSGDFLDPTQNPTKLLINMRHVSCLLAIIYVRVLLCSQLSHRSKSNSEIQDARKNRTTSHGIKESIT